MEYQPLHKAATCWCLPFVSFAGGTFHELLADVTVLRWCWCRAVGDLAVASVREAVASLYLSPALSAFVISRKLVCSCFGKSIGRYVFAACGEDALVFVELRASYVVLVLSGRVQSNTSFVVLRRVYRRDYTEKRRCYGT